MKSISQLQKKSQLLTDQINDIFHAASLNLQALSVQLQSFSESKPTLRTLNQCQRQFENIQNLFKKRASLRLQYLITQQIKQQEAKVRRQRLIEYEQKIYDQRRLISDKQSFYEGLLKPRRKRPAHMTIEQFQAQRRQQILLEERNNLRRLEDQINELKIIEKTLSIDNQHLAKILKDLNNEDISEQELLNLAQMVEQNPIIYSNLKKFPEKKQDINEIKKIFNLVQNIEVSNHILHKQYLEQRQMNQYLKWDFAKLKAQYNQKQQQQLFNNIKQKMQLHKYGKYKLKRSCSI